MVKSAIFEAFIHNLPLTAKSCHIIEIRDATGDILHYLEIEFYKNDSSQLMDRLGKLLPEGLTACYLGTSPLPCLSEKSLDTLQCIYDLQSTATALDAASTLLEMAPEALEDIATIWGNAKETIQKNEAEGICG